MIGIIGHHFSVGTGMRAAEAARLGKELGVDAMEISTIPCDVALGFAGETGADYGEKNNKPQIDTNDSEDDWRNIRRAVEKEGMQISALGGYNDFALPSEKLVEEKARIIRQCRMAEVLDVDVIRVFAGDYREGLDREAALDQIVECFKEVVSYAESAKVNLAIENHLRLANDADTLLSIIDRVGSPNLKITLDFTNFYWLNADVHKTMEMIRRVAPYTVHSHFKNARFEKDKCVFTSLGEGDLDVPLILETLREAGYERPFFIACEDRDFSKQEDIMDGFSRTIEYFKTLNSGIEGKA